MKKQNKKAHELMRNPSISAVDCLVKVYGESSPTKISDLEPLKQAHNLLVGWCPSKYLNPFGPIYTWQEQDRSSLVEAMKKLGL